MIANEYWSVALVGPFAVRGIYVGQNLYTWRPLKLLARSVANLLVPALFLFVALAAWRRDGATLWFFALTLFSYALHSGITQNIDRFSWPILPEGAIALAGLVALAVASARQAAAGRAASPAG